MRVASFVGFGLVAFAFAVGLEVRAETLALMDSLRVTR
jgi:hypothetical protein